MSTTRLAKRLKRTLETEQTALMVKYANMLRKELKAHILKQAKRVYECENAERLATAIYNAVLHKHGIE